MRLLVFRCARLPLAGRCDVQRQTFNLSCLCAAEVEGQYLADVAKRRWPVLIFVFCFDVGCYLLRLGAKLLAGEPTTPVGLISSLSPQLANMAMCYLFLSYVNRRSRRLGDHAARQVGNQAVAPQMAFLHVATAPRARWAIKLPSPQMAFLHVAMAHITLHFRHRSSGI